MQNCALLRLHLWLTLTSFIDGLKYTYSAGMTNVAAELIDDACITVCANVLLQASPTYTGGLMRHGLTAQDNVTSTSFA